ncbi:hypothetical protein [Bradyrhizobium diazoefficiens]
MTELLLLICRWVIPPCVAVAVLMRISAPILNDLKAMIPAEFSLARKAPKVDLDREIQRLLDGW